jgi:hypothetical protein
LLLAAGALGLALSGCAEKVEPVVVLRPPIEWDDVATVPVGDVADGFVNLAPEGTDGLFPSSIAVVRLTAAESGDEGRSLVLDMHPPNDFLPWNSLFDSLRYVRDAFPLNSHDLSGDPPVPARLVQAAGELRAGLCLVYGCTDLSQVESRTRGLLYDTRNGKALAAIEAAVSVPAPEAVPHPPDQVEDDLRHCDARYLTDRRFEALVYECVRDLQMHNRPVPPRPEEGWTPQGPLSPRTWPPPVAAKP